MINVHNIKRAIVRGINSIIPKNKKKVMFASFPDFADNSRAVYEYMMRQEKFSNWTFIWEVSPDFQFPTRNRTRFIKRPYGYWNKDYFIYIFNLFTSKYLFSTHSFFVEANPSRQISVCLWHGTMLKRICAMNEREKDGQRKDQFRFFFFFSNYYNDIFCKTFLCQPENILTTGYPRNDFLFENTRLLEKLNIDKDLYSKIVVYMPTFRVPKGGGYCDSDATIQSCIDFANKQSLSELSYFLYDKKVLLLIKWHPADSRQFVVDNMANILSIDNQVLAESGFQAYHLLHYADALITDYSSVFCDYMLLDRPIAFDVSDIVAYADKRGFVFEKPMDFMPGYIIKTEHDLKIFVDDISKGLDKSAYKRRELYSVYNDFCDDQASARIVNLTIHDLSVGF